MKKKTKIITLLAVVLLIVLIVVANMLRLRTTVRGVQVSIDYDKVDTLVLASSVERLILDSLPTLTQQQLSKVDLHEVERVAASSPFLIDCDASTTIGGYVMLYARQRRPIVRVFTTSQHYYIDETGVQVPLSAVGNCDVIVANGSIKSKGKHEREVYDMARWLQLHPEYAPLFDQIFCSSNGDLFLTPKLGDHVVQVGQPTELENKMRNLMALYTQGLPQVGWDSYSQVSVKYRGQVVCTRR